MKKVISLLSSHPRPSIFISSTTNVKERRALARQLQRKYSPFISEWYQASSNGRTSPLDICRKEIECSHVFIGLLGSDYGSVYTFPCNGQPGQGQDHAGHVKELSISEWEYETARGCNALAIQMFQKSVPPASVHPRQQAFIDRVMNFGQGAWCSTYDSTSRLIELVRDRLETWLLEDW